MLWGREEAHVQRRTRLGQEESSWEDIAGADLAEWFAVNLLAWLAMATQDRPVAVFANICVVALFTVPPHGARPARH